MCAREAGGAARGKSKLTYNSHTGNLTPSYPGTLGDVCLSLLEIKRRRGTLEGRLGKALERVKSAIQQREKWVSELRKEKRYRGEREISLCAEIRKLKWSLRMTNSKEGLTRGRLRNKILRKEAKDWKIKAGLDREKARLAERCRNRSDRVFKEKLEKERRELDCVLKEQREVWMDLVSKEVEVEEGEVTDEEAWWEEEDGVLGGVKVGRL